MISLVLSWVLRALLLLPLPYFGLRYLGGLPMLGVKPSPYVLLIAVACLVALWATFSANGPVSRWAHVLGSVLLVGAFLAAFGGPLLVMLPYWFAG